MVVEENEELLIQQAGTRIAQLVSIYLSKLITGTMYAEDWNNPELVPRDKKDDPYSPQLTSPIPSPVPSNVVRISRMLPTPFPTNSLPNRYHIQTSNFINNNNNQFTLPINIDKAPFLFKNGAAPTRRSHYYINHRRIKHCCFYINPT